MILSQAPYERGAAAARRSRCRCGRGCRRGRAAACRCPSRRPGASPRDSNRSPTMLTMPSSSAVTTRASQAPAVGEKRDDDSVQPAAPIRPPADAFPGLARADRGRELAPAPGAADEIGGAVRDPDEHEHEQHHERLKRAPWRGPREPARRSRPRRPAPSWLGCDAAPHPERREHEPERRGQCEQRLLQARALEARETSSATAAAKTSARAALEAAQARPLAAAAQSRISADGEPRARAAEAGTAPLSSAAISTAASAELRRAGLSGDLGALRGFELLAGAAEAPLAAAIRGDGERRARRRRSPARACR